MTFLQFIGRRSKCCNARFTYILGRHYKGYEDFTGCSNCHKPKGWLSPTANANACEQTRTGV